MIHATDSLTIDVDEGEFILVVTTEEGETHRYNIHGQVFEFYKTCQVELRPYVLEAESARATMPQLVTNRPVSVEDAIEAGYALDDPKSPGYHDRMVGAENLAFDEGAECEHAAAELGESGIV